MDDLISRGSRYGFKSCNISILFVDSLNAYDAGVAHLWYRHNLCSFVPCHHCNVALEQYWLGKMQ